MKRYPLDQSPFYKLSNRRKLAELLGLTIQDLNQIAKSNTGNYKCFPKTIEKDGKSKTRYIEYPKPVLRAIQKRLARLLNRIEPPEYLHSGFSGRSYITNALRHANDVPIAKIDIKKFFPSAYAGYVHRSFEDIFKCSPDVAGIITKVTTIRPLNQKGHIPTGGNSSTIISFFAFKPMFDKIFELAKSRGLTMSCCVDDMTFSGQAATRGFLNEVHLIVSQYGLKTHKRICFTARQNKIVTGVAITAQGARLPNSRRKKLHDAFLAYNQETDAEEKYAIATKLLGRATEAAQVEKSFGEVIPIANQKLQSAKRGLQTSG